MTTPLRKFLALSPTREQLEDWCQQRARVVPAGDYNLCRVLGSKLIYAHQRDYAIMPHLALHGIWEPWVTMAIARHVKLGMCCLDVGACYGYFTLLLEDLVGCWNGQGYVEAWEPCWSEALDATLRVNGSTAVLMPYPMGCGGEVFQSSPGDLFFNAGNAVPAHSVASKTMQVPAHCEYDFIKIDVEGAEVDVWNALRTTGCLDKPGLVVCMEFTPGQHDHPHLEVENLVKAGFSLGSVGHDGIPRPCTIDEAVTPDTGDFRMLWLAKVSG